MRKDTDKGSIRWHQNRWEIRVQVNGDRLTRRIKAPNTRAGRRIAEDALDALVVASSVGDERMTVEAMLARYELLKSPGWSPSTKASFPWHSAAILAEFGDKEVGRLRRNDIEALYAGWLAAGVSAGTVKRRHVVLAAALRQAERWGVIAVSPARDVELPRGMSAAAADLPGLTDVLAAILRLDHERLKAVAWLAVVTGARRGELVGLRWRDIDLDAGVVQMKGAMSVGPDDQPERKSTKTGRPKTVGIDPGTVSVLRAWRRTIVEAAVAAGGTAGTGSPVFPSPTDPSTPWHPHQVTSAWARKRDGIGLGDLRFHDLRHVSGSHLIGEGVAVTTVAARLGHASSKMTLDVYGHAVAAGDERATAVMGVAVEAARKAAAE